MRKANPLHALIVFATFCCWACVDDGGGPQNEGDVAQDGTSQTEQAGGAVAEGDTDITRSDSGDSECASNDDCGDGQRRRSDGDSYRCGDVDGQFESDDAQTYPPTMWMPMPH